MNPPIAGRDLISERWQIWRTHLGNFYSEQRLCFGKDGFDFFAERVGDDVSTM